MGQNVWQGDKIVIHKQRRRAELVRSFLKRSGRKTLLDIGSAKGFVTSILSSGVAMTYGIEIDMEYIKVAKQKVPNSEFINASMEYLPFKDRSFDAVCILEVLEHLPAEIQKKGIAEAEQVLKDKGSLIISIPYKENIIRTKCIHCGKITPLYGHLHSMEEEYITSKLPRSSHFLLVKKYRLPNIQVISCKTIFEPLPLRLWLLVNDILGLAKKGYWIVLHYER
ncbi:MAG: methyltransferase domain-containing protein [Nitrososphaeraceae archaeon]|nr:methyltransferase domain-containing protein [Nitrososphaeraceae archaeon]